MRIKVFAAGHQNLQWHFLLWLLHCLLMFPTTLGCTLRQCPQCVRPTIIGQARTRVDCCEETEQRIAAPVDICCVFSQVEDLARVSFSKTPLYVGVDDDQETATREGLEQGYCVVPAEQRMMLLFTFLKKNQKKKVPVIKNSSD